MEKYTTTPENAMATLAQYGVAIIPSILSAAECATLLDKMWAFFEEITDGMPNKIKRYDSKTWNTLLDLLPSHGMLFQHWGVGQSEFAWWVRQHEAVVNAFATMWKVDPQNLLTSFDGASFQAPPDRKGNPHPERGWGSSKHWFHSDQSLKRPGRECIQGWVTANPVEEGDATLRVLEGSHVYHAELAKKFPKLVKGVDWVRYNDEVIAFFTEKKCEPVRITCPAGSLVLWDSRTAHYGAPPLRNRKNKKFRAIVYVSMLPRAFATAKWMEKKRAAFTKQRTTTHWGNKAKLFAEVPQTFGQPLPLVRKAALPTLTALGRRLAGFD